MEIAQLRLIYYHYSMLIKFLILSLLSSSNIGHAYQYFHYDRKKVKLSIESFSRWVRPQARTIIREYYSILNKMHPIHSELMSLNNKVKKLSRLGLSKSGSCLSKSPHCYPFLKEAYSYARVIERKIFNIQNDKIRLKKREQDPPTDFESVLKLIRAIGHLRILNYKLLHSLEELMITTGTSYFHPSYLEQWSRDIHQMKLLSEEVTHAMLPRRFKEPFEQLFISFIKPLEEHIDLKRDPEFFLSNLEQFNLAWNAYHMLIVKSNLHASKPVMTQVKTMHRRWNSILKVVLGSYRFK